MRRVLDSIYCAAGWLAAGALLLIFVLVALQITFRLIDGGLRLVGATPLGLIVPSIAEISGFLLAAASFLALARTLVTGGHIRVGMLVDRLPGGARRIVETAVGLLAFAVSAFATWSVGRLAGKSLAFHDVSYGMIAVPLWLPQAAMTLGLAILSVAILDVTLAAWRERRFLQSGPEA